MSRFANENQPFVSVIKELPRMISRMGYNPIDPRIINNRTGVYMTLLALFRLPEVNTDQEFIQYITSKIGKDLNIDPYELLTPNDYRLAAGTRKMEYRKSADTRAYTLLNELVNDSKALHRELLNLTRKEDLPDKVEKVVSKAELAFKRIVSLKEFSFGGAYLLDEDIYNPLTDFEKQLKDLSILSTNSTDYLELSTFIIDIGKLTKNSSKLVELKNDGFKKHFIKAHETIVDLYERIRKKIETKLMLCRVLEDSIQFTEDFISRVKQGSHVAFDVAGFEPIPNMILTIKKQYENDLGGLMSQFDKAYSTYKDRCPEQILHKSAVNPAYMKNVCNKFDSVANDFYNSLDPFIMLHHKDELHLTFESIEWFYSECAKRTLSDSSFKESVDKSFKFKKRLTKNET